MEPLISIIIPVYNVKPYLKKCVDSVIAQTYRNIEIILVDDGSKDGSGDLCDELREIDSRITIYHKENGGLSSARNYGIERASGEYIGLVDSDDYIESDMYETLLRLAKNNDADMSMCAMCDVYGDRKCRVETVVEEKTVSREEAIKMVLVGEVVSVSAVNKLYKRSLFDNIRYPEGKTLEDAFVIVDLLNICNIISITSAQKYFYVHRNESITTRKYDGKIDAIEAYTHNYEIIEAAYPNLLDVAKMRLCWAHFYVLDRVVMNDINKYLGIKTKCINYIRSNLPFIIKSPYFTLSRKIAAILLMIDQRLYKRCVFLQNRRRGL